LPAAGHSCLFASVSTAMHSRRYIRLLALARFTR
jgi:hypothetical protein